MEEEINSKVTRLREIKNQIESSNSLLEETTATVEAEQKRLKIKQKGLDQFQQISFLTGMNTYPEFSERYADVANALVDITSMGCDPKLIVSEYSKFKSLRKAKEKVKTELQESEKLLQHYRSKLDEEKARWRDREDAIESLTHLKKAGLKEDHIFMTVNLLENDFPETEITKILEDIRMYGSIAAALSKLKREYENETEEPLDD